MLEAALLTEPSPPGSGLWGLGYTSGQAIPKSKGFERRRIQHKKRWRRALRSPRTLPLRRIAASPESLSIPGQAVDLGRQREEFLARATSTF